MLGQCGIPELMKHIIINFNPTVDIKGTEVLCGVFLQTLLWFIKKSWWWWMSYLLSICNIVIYSNQLFAVYKKKKRSKLKKAPNVTARLLTSLQSTVSFSFLVVLLLFYYVTCMCFIRNTILAPILLGIDSAGCWKLPVGDSGPFWHDRITSFLQTCQLHVSFLFFEVIHAFMW